MLACTQLKNEDLESIVQAQILENLQGNKDSFTLCTSGVCDNFKFISLDCAEEKQYRVMFSLDFSR